MFFLSFVDPAAVRSEFTAPIQSARAANVPFYKAHCRLLI
jgi:hypothetical protein